MAFKDHKKGITRAFIMALILFLMCFGVFSCSNYMETERKSYVDMATSNLVQLDEPEEDAPAVCIHTSLGDIVAELYPEEAPDYVAQFTKLAEEGFYDNTYIYDVENGVYFQAGSAQADGSLAAGADDTNEKVEQEISSDLWPFRGAFCVPTTSQKGNVLERMLGKTINYCGSRFIVCNSIVFDETTKSELDEVSEKAKDLTDAFLERGGIPNYSQQMTIFAQAYGDESFDTIDAITGVETITPEDDDSYATPKEDVKILSIEVGIYGDFSKKD